jgi:F0F1-type ATP synthase alpha subunit|tara:strand:+ start:528 stop:812 length:285 start_codon:yes stop_codon:yes gene_type:complete
MEKYTMSNDLTLSDIQTVIKAELEKAKRDILVKQNSHVNSIGSEVINYQAVCQYLDYEIFEFVMTSNNPEVKRFGQKIMQGLSERFNINERLNT